MTCLFLVGNSNQARMMSRVAGRLRQIDSGFAVMALTLEPYVLEGASAALRQTDVAFFSLADYPGKGPLGILRELSPAVLVVGHDNTTITRPFVEASKCLAIPSLLMQDGVIGRASVSGRKTIAQTPGYLSRVSKWQRNYRFLIGSLRDANFSLLGAIAFAIRDVLTKLAYGTLYGRAGCTRIAVFGEYFRELFVMHGIPAERIVVTGHPLMDEIPVCNHDRETVRQVLGLPLDKAVVLLLTTATVEYNLWRPSQRRSFMAHVLRACAEVPEVQLVIKLHPREKVEEYHELIRDLGFEVPVYRDVDLHEVLGAADAAITTYSSTGLDALILGKPLIVFDLFNKVEPVPYVGSGAALGVYSPKDLRSAILAVLQDDETKRRLKDASESFVYRLAYRLDGRAAERVAALIAAVSQEDSGMRESGSGKPQNEGGERDVFGR